MRTIYRHNKIIKLVHVSNTATENVRGKKLYLNLVPSALYAIVVDE